MARFVTPDPQDAKDTIADCLALLNIDVASANRHDQIVDNCVAPISLLFHAGELISSAGPEEEAVFAYFLAVLRDQMERFGSRAQGNDMLAARNR